MRNIAYVSQALESHATGKGHCKKVKERKEIRSFFTKRQSVSKSSEKEKDVEQVENVTPKTTETMEVPTCSKTGQSTIIETFSDEGKIHAEILWSIKHVLSGYSDNSVKDRITLFQQMFPDSKVSSRMDLGPGKIRYVVNHDIAPYFKTMKSFYLTVLLLALMEA